MNKTASQMATLDPVIELRVLAGDNAGAQIHLTADRPVVIGKHPQCDWKLSGESVADFHCKLEVKKGRLLVSPMSGTIILNGTPVLIRNSTVFKLGDVIALGSMKVQIGVELARTLSIRDTAKPLSLPAPNPGAWLAPCNKVLRGLGARVSALSIPKGARIPSLMVACTGVAMCAVVLTAPATMNAHIIDQSHQATLMGLANQMAKDHEAALEQVTATDALPDTAPVLERVKLQVRASDAESLIVPGTAPDNAVATASLRNHSVSTSPVVFTGYSVDTTPFLLASDGSMYVENAALPGGGRLISISPVSYSIETSDGIRIISTKHLEQLSGDQVDETRLTQAILQAHPDGNVLAIQLRTSPFDRFISKAANTYDIDPSLIKAVVQVESNFDPLAVSSAGALGLMQLMPSTAERFELDDPFHAEGNIMAGSQYLRILLDKYNNDVEMALAAYNAGEGSVRRYKGVPPYKETQNYIKKVTGLLASYQQSN